MNGNAILSNENNEIMTMSGFFYDSKGFSLRFCMEWFVCAKYDLGGCVWKGWEGVWDIEETLTCIIWEFEKVYCCWQTQSYEEEKVSLCNWGKNTCWNHTVMILI